MSPERLAPAENAELGSFVDGRRTVTWPDSLDALAAAPESHRILFENDAVRVLETGLRPVRPPRCTRIDGRASSTSSRSAISCDGMATECSWSTRVKAAHFRRRAPRSGV